MRSSVLVLLLVVVVYAHQKDLPLPPIIARNIGDHSAQPSGVTFSSATRRLYINCDACPVLTEFTQSLEYVQDLVIGQNVPDLECVACADDLGLLFIGIEEERRVEAFLLDDYVEGNDGEQHLIPAFSLDLDFNAGELDDRTGLEGMTYNENTQTLICGNEMIPTIIAEFELNGQIRANNVIDWAKDISGLAYDTDLDMLWLVSDREEKVFLTDLTGDVLIDSWDLALKNTEGIAIDNTVEPNMMYIVTDPNTKGDDPTFLPLIVGYEKPVAGTGYANYDPKNLPSYVTNPPPCDGCDEAFIGISNYETFESDSSSDSGSSRTMVSLFFLFSGLILFI